MEHSEKLIRFLKQMEKQGKWGYLNGEPLSPKELLDKGVSWPEVCRMVQVSVVRVIEEAIREEEEAKLKVQSISTRTLWWIDDVNN